MRVRFSAASLVVVLVVIGGCIAVAPGASPTAPPATPSEVPSVLPTASPVQSASPSPTASPSTASPSVVPTLGDLSPAEAILAALVPDAFRGSCESGDLIAGALATIECLTQVEGNNVRIRYSQFAFVEDMEAAYDDGLNYMGIETRDQGSCADTWPAEGSYAIAGVPTGRIACAVVGDFMAGELETIAWTNESVRVEALAQGYSDITTELLYDFWTGAGPVPDGTSPSPAPTAPTGTDGPFPTAAETALIGHIPASFSSECTRYSLGRPESALAAVECPVELDAGSLTVSYFQWASAEGLDAAYTRNLDFLGITRDSGPCTGTWPAEGPYTIGDEPGGRVGCGVLGGVAPMIAWTDDQLLISVLAEGFGAEQAAMYQWWLGDSGPVR